MFGDSSPLGRKQRIMPSRKKAKGKARKAAKEAKAKEGESRALVAVAANQRQEESVEAQMQQLEINATSKCLHGSRPFSGDMHICLEFINVFTEVYVESNTDGLSESFNLAFDGTEEKYADVYDYMLETVISMILFIGTQYILDGKNDVARLYASFASYFNEIVAVSYHETKAVPSWTKIGELSGGDDHTLISYYRKHIPCSCLDEKYKEVKSIKKMGRCYNSNCNLPGGRVEKGKMLSCNRCRHTNYCSVECQKADWKRHKENCDNIAEKKDAFKSERAQA